MKDNKGITYEILQEKDFEETTALLSEIFSQGEPVTKSLEITPKEFHYFAEIYCKKAVKEGISMIARHKDKNKIIAFILSEDFDSPPPEGIENIDKKVVPLMALVDAVEMDAKSNKKERERRFHMFLGATDKNYENRHILTTLVEKSLKLAKSKNFTVAIAEPSGFETQHIFNKLEFKQRNMVVYKKFLFEGKKVFKNIVGPVGLPLMEKRL